MPNDPSRITGSTSRRTFIATAGAASGFSLAGCLGGGGGGDGGVSGTIEASGSNTVAPITGAAAEDFEAEYGDAQVNVDPQGTGAGFSEFAQGNSDIQSASREIDDEEAAEAEENDVEYSLYTIGQDGLCVVKNAENDWMDEISLDELREVWEFESEIETWSDLNPDYPDEEMILYARDDASGTFDYFTLEINGEVGNIRDDYSAHSQTDNVMQGVAADLGGFGWGGLGYYLDFEDDLELLAVESDEDGEYYLPDEENIESGVYSPLTRPLFIYVNHASLEENPDLLGSFVRFYFNGQLDFAPEVGFFATPDEQVDENHDEFDGVLSDMGIEDEITEERA